MERKEFEKQVPQLRFLAMQIGKDFFGNRDDAEDVAQDALERLWRYCERLNADRNIEALAVMVAKNICIEKYKRRQIMVDSPPSDPVACETYGADANLLSEEAREIIEGAIATLSPREQQLITKRYLEDHSAEEISQETGIPKPSVKSMLSMAKAKLKKKLRR